MSNWVLLIIDGSAHVINLDSEVVEIKDFGRFPTKLLHDYKFNFEFELFEKKAKLVSQSKQIYSLILKEAHR